MKVTVLEWTKKSTKYEVEFCLVKNVRLQAKGSPCELGANIASKANESEYENANLYRDTGCGYIYDVTKV